jgi:hypothetical protein
MSAPDPSPSRDVLERARAYVRVDERVVAALPELREAIRSFQPVPGPAGESVAEWLMERALSMPQEATVRVRLSHGRVAGVYALCAAQVALSREERAQLATVLVVDPFDEQTANMWQERFGFQDSEQPVPGNPRLRRQWLSLQS